MEGHIEGMLDRDQRTAKMPSFLRHRDLFSSTERTPSVATPVPRRRLCCPTRTPHCKPSHLACRNGYLLNTFQSVRNVLLVVCITLVTIPIVSSKPIEDMTSLEKLSQTPMKWVDPCAGKVTGDLAPPNSSFNKTEIDNIITEANSTLNYVHSLQSQFTAETYQNTPESDVQKNLKNQRLEWLTNFYEVLEGDYQNLRVEDVLNNVYTMLQKMAVGLEQITLEQVNNTMFKEQFETLEFQVRRLLCELHEVLQFHGQSIPSDVPREYMQDKDREGDTLFKKTRNYIIIRDFVNTLEYLKAALGYFRQFATS